MAQVFISYVSSDREVVARIANGLVAAGFSVWWDRDLIGGQEYSKIIDREIAAAQVVIPVWSDASVQSRWVAAEAARGSDKLLPVRIDAAEPPLPYNQLQTLDLRGWKGDASDARWSRLLADLGVVVAGHGNASRPSPPPQKRKQGAATWIAAAAFAAALAVGAFIFYPHSSVRPEALKQANGDTSALVTTPPAEASRSPATNAAPAQSGPAIQTYEEALQTIRQSGGQISLQLCASASACGLHSVHVGQLLTIRIRSEVSGRLMLLDEDSSGAQSQIYPNGFSRSGAGFELIAGRTAELPLQDQGFVFAASPPLGRSHLVAVVYPRMAQLPAIVAENSRTRGIQPIPVDRRDDFAAATTHALSAHAPGARVVAFGEVTYEVVP